MATPLVQYLLSAASSGTSPTTVADSAPGTAVDLIAAFGASGSWTSDAQGNGISFSGSGSGAASGNLTGTKVNTGLNGLQKSTLEVVYRHPTTLISGTIDFLFGFDDFGSEQVTLRADTSSIQIVVKNSVIGSFAATGGTKYVVHVVVDTTQATSTNRVKVYVNGSLVSISGYVAPTLNDTFTASAGHTTVSIGCYQTAGTDRLQSSVFYAAIYPADITADISTNATNLAANHDADPAGTGPTITSQPASQSLFSGQTPTTLSVSATASPGGGSLSYQCKLNGSNISGATSSTYSPGAVTSANDGDSYTFAVTDANGTTLSAAAVITVLTDPAYIAASAIAYSATNPAPTYPSLAANDELWLIVGQKPASTTPGGGSVTTPTGFTLITSLLATGGYGATIAADTGDTNLYVYKKDTVSGSESGTLTITTSGGTNHVAWAVFIQVRSSTGVYSDATATAGDTSGGNISLAFGAIDVQADDILIAAMCTPTDINTPGTKYSAEAFAGSGLTTGTVVEIAEAGSSLGFDIGGVLAYAIATAGAGSTAVTFSATVGGTTTNVRGPGALIRVRKGSSGSTGTGSAAASPFAGSASGTVTFTATGSAARTSFAASGAAAETFTGSAAGAESPFASSAAGTYYAASGAAAAALAAFAAASTGSETFTGTAAAARAAFAASAAALETFTGTVTSALAAFAASTTGAETFAGGATAAASAFAAAASGLQSLSGTASAALAAFAAALGGSETFSGTATGAAAPFGASGTAGGSLSGAGSAAAAPFGGSASGTETFTGTAAAAASSPAATGAGTETLTGTGAGAASPFAGAAAGINGLAGAGSAALPPVGAASSGTETFAGSASAAVAAFAALATATETYLGTVAAALAPFGASGTSGVGSSVTGSGSVAASAFAAVAAATETFLGSAAAAIAPQAAAGAGAETMAGAATAGLAGFAPTSSGAESFLAVVSAALASFQGAGSGAQGTVLVGSAAAILAPFASAASAAETFAGSGSAARAPFTGTGTSVESFSAAVTAAIARFQGSAAGIQGNSFITGTAAAALTVFAVAAAATVLDRYMPRAHLRGRNRAEPRPSVTAAIPDPTRTRVVVNGTRTKTE